MSVNRGINALPVTPLDTPCIEYQGSRSAEGYGHITWNGRNTRAHRRAYCLSNNVTLDEIDGMCVMHKCDNPPCINGDHLELGTRGDNNRDRAAKGRSGVRRPSRCHLTDEQAQYIRDNYRSRCRENGASALAARFNIDRRAIYAIRKGHSYRELLRL